MQLAYCIVARGSGRAGAICCCVAGVPYLSSGNEFYGGFEQPFASQGIGDQTNLFGSFQ